MFNTLLAYEGFRTKKHYVIEYLFTNPNVVCGQMLEGFNDSLMCLAINTRYLSLVKLMCNNWTKWLSNMNSEKTKNEEKKKCLMLAVKNIALSMDGALFSSDPIPELLLKLTNNPDKFGCHVLDNLITLLNIYRIVSGEAESKGLNPLELDYM